jgi:hypothetical protein
MFVLVGVLLCLPAEDSNDSVTFCVSVYVCCFHCLIAN